MTLTSAEGFVNGSQFESPSFSIIATFSDSIPSLPLESFTVTSSAPGVVIAKALSGSGSTVSHHCLCGLVPVCARVACLT